MLRSPVARVIDRPVTLATVVSVVLCVVLGMRISIIPFAPIAGLLGIVLLPVVLPGLRRHRFLPLLVGLLAASIVSGAMLTSFYAASHETSWSYALTRTLMIASLVGGIGVVLYAREHLGTAGTAIAYGAGLVAIAVSEPSSASNPWRFTYSLPVAVLVLAVLSLRPTVTAQVVGLVGLGVIGLLNDSRSNSAILFLAAVILLWQRFAHALTRGRRRTGHIFGLLLFAAGFFQLMQFALLEGYLGEATQAKTEAQIETGGNLLLGGRPEAAASFALISRYPLGQGSGVIPTTADVYAAKSSMSEIGYDPNNGYVERFMFGSGVEVHSLLGDFWLWFGIPGLLACAAMAAVVVWGLEQRLRNAALTGLLAFLSIRFFWDLLFSPAASSMRMLVLTIPLAALAVASQRASRGALETVTGRSIATAGPLVR